MRAWIDIDNPPQVQYLLPLARRLEAAGHDLLITARAYGDTFAILRSEGVAFEAAGIAFGKGIPRKLVGLYQRARLLNDFVRTRPEPVDFLLTGSRAATVAARMLRIPSFVIIDYEYVDVLAYALSGSYVLHPRFIDPATFRRRGVARGRLLPFDGLKEDISFADVDVASVQPHVFEDSASAFHVLVRPPAEDSHYYRRQSRDLALELLLYLAAQDVSVVFSPRTAKQIRYLDAVPRWQREPVVLERPVPFVSLLKAVDAVVSAGGTMLREAAYLGIPAYSIFQGRVGAVDRYLASLNRLSLLESTRDFPRLELEHRSAISLLRVDPEASERVLAMILDRVAGTALA